MAKLLLAEDDPNLGFMVKDNLEELNFHVAWAKNGVEAIDIFHSSPIDLCLIDVMMPKMDGFELAQKIREANDLVPIIFLTAKSMEEDRLQGFEIGGDDYLTKPFSMKELAYRINVFLRRKGSSQVSTSQLAIGNSTFDTQNLLYFCNDSSFSLTQMEAQLLMLLIEHKNQLVKRETILLNIWGENDYFKGRSLDVFITRLRKYLKHDAKLEIKNHHGVGFTLKEMN